MEQPVSIQHSSQRFRQFIASILFLLCSGIAYASTAPYVRITGEDGVKTLTFYYGGPTDDALEVADDFYNSARSWASDASSIGKVVFDSSLKFRKF